MRAGDTARDVEGLLVWAYRDQMVDQSGTGVTYGGQGNPYGAVVRGLQLGATVDGTGAHGWMAADPVAEAVHEAVMARRMGWLIGWARRNDRPDWGEAGQSGRAVVIRCVARRYNGGRGQVEMIYPGEGQGHRAIGCRLAWVPYEFTHLDMLHAEWERWWDALSVLAGDLTAALGRPVGGPPLSRRPWLANGSLDSGGVS